MIVHILKKNKLAKLNLPNKINGVYSVLDDNDKVLANIEAVNNEWVLRSNPAIEIVFNGKTVEDVKVVPYIIYTIKRLIDNSITVMIVTPEYDANVKHYVAKSNTITIGSDENSSICFRYGLVANHVTLTKNKNYWVATTNQPYTYISNRPFKKKNMFHGDYIFINGLKVIVINDYFIINNPNNLVHINNVDLEEKVIPKQQYTPEKEISDDIPLFGKDQYFLKAPRFKSKIETATVKIDTPPAKQEDNLKNPAILQYGPRITMSITTFYALFTTLQNYALGQTTFGRMVPQLIAAGTMLLSSFFWPALTRKLAKNQAKKQEILRQRKYIKYLEKKEQKIEEIKELQKQILIENNTPLEECQSIIYNRKRNLWERNIENDDFLSVRLGTGRVECDIEIDDPSDSFTIEDEDRLKSNLDEILENAKYIDDCPMDLSLLDKRITAIVGNNVLTKYFMDSLFLQIMTFHSYTDLKIVTLTSKTNEYLWEFLKTLPHSWDNFKTNRYFATNSDEMNYICTIIEKDFNDRKSKDENSKVEDNGDENKTLYTQYRPYYLIFIDNLDVARNISLVKKVLSYKKNLGFSIVIRNDRLSNLPSECSTFVNVTEELSGLFENDLISNNQKQFKAEFNKKIDMYGCAQRLANIPIQKEKAKYELPSSVSFLSMYKVGKVEQLNSLERWRSNNPVTSLSVPVGINQEGELFKMDIHEKAWGPHGLVAGTTGSGKSEWIITYILSLAVNFHPDEVQFVLIDYKGGGLALAFENEEMGVKLPHLAGTITNLDKSVVNRAIASIEAELKRRQAAFNEAREKLKDSSMNIYKYQQYYRKGMLEEPMSHLFIISDEFAELKSQEPEFLEQLVSTARIGRSLGVHLILATQKPSGVVSDQIWSNSRFKVCLRVQDKADSNEMLKTPDAAMLKTTGAFYLQVGFNEFYQLGQSAWAGAKYYPSDIVQNDIDQSVQYIDNLGKTLNSFDENSFGNKEVKENQGEELLNIVSYISNITKNEKVFCRQLWLPNIPSVIYIDNVKKKYNITPEKFSPIVTIGEYDDPSLQKQDVYKLSLDANTALYGETGSGKENLLATIIWSSIIDHTPQEINFYIIDFGAETLRMFAKFPHVGEVVFQDEVDRVAGVLDMIAEEIEERKKLFADYNGNYESYLKESGKTLPRLIVIINAWDVFVENLGRISDVVTTMFRDGLKYGISFILTTSDYKAIRPKVGALFANKLVLHQPSDDNYRIITDCKKGLIPAKEFSRGIGPVMGEDKYCEFQGAYITELSKINQLVRKNADNFAQYYDNVRAKSLPKIPDNITSAELEKFVTDIENVPVGYNFHEKDLAKFNFEKQKLFMIGIDNMNERMSSLYGIINTLAKVPGTKVRVLDAEKIYKAPALDIRLFQEKIDATIVALESDLESRAVTADHGITFVLGIGNLKSKLTVTGQEHLNNYLDIISKANKSTIVLVDTYDRLKKIKVEPWYAKINTSYGIWIGNNISNQSLFSVNQITMEERKLEYDGMAYLIDDSNYTLIKTVMDGDE